MSHDHPSLTEDSDHVMVHDRSEAVNDYWQRFIFVSLLLLPLILVSKPGIALIGLPEFAGAKYLQFGIATAIFLFAKVFFEHARHEIKTRQYGMMTLVSVAVGAGYLFSAASTFFPQLEAEFYLEISTLIWVLLFGHYLEARSSVAAGDALWEVAKLLPKQAHLVAPDGVEDVEIEHLKPGDVVLVKPGEKVPADGAIIEGQSSFNEAHISGESKPLEKKKADRVVAGAICLDGSVTVKLDRVGENSTIGQIQKLIKQAQQTKPSAQRLADRISGILTLIALSIAVLTVLVWSLVIGQTLVFSLTLAITVLVVACPHALGLAIPAVSTIATQLAVKNGVFLKDLSKLEVVKDIDYVVFDKTGTLTRGKFGVTDVVAFGEMAGKSGGGLTKRRQELVRIAASLEVHSAHVIGLAVVKFATEQGIKPKDAKNFKNIAGKGIEGIVEKKKYAIGNMSFMEEKGLFGKEAKVYYQKFSDKGKTVAFLSDNVKILGLISLSDRVKPESKEAILKLHQMGINVAMLTGDSREVAQAVAHELSIDTHLAQVIPKQKYKYIKKLQNEGNRVMMVGDGINDAPALTQADVGVAVGAGTDVAIEAGDIVLTRNNPRDIVSLVILSKKVYRKMAENLIWAFAYNLLAIPAAAGLFIPLGLSLTPKLGALLMSLSSIMVVINAMTLKKAKLEIESEAERG